jgi:hypothetical protein
MKNRVKKFLKRCSRISESSPQAGQLRISRLPPDTSLFTGLVPKMRMNA